jgi:hypothetical protein
VSHPPGIPLLQRVFHSAAGITVDENDLRRFPDFVDGQIDSIPIAGRDAAKRNRAKGVHGRMREFDKLNAAADVWSPSRLPELRFRCGRRFICCSIPPPLSWFAWWFASLEPE